MRDQSNSKENAQSEAKPSTHGRRSRVTNKTRKHADNATFSEKIVEPKVDTASLENALFESASEFAKSKGYKITRNPRTGLSMLVSRRVEVSSNQFLVDLIPFSFHDKVGLIKYDDANGGHLQVVEGESDNINESCNDLAEQIKTIATNLFQGYRPRDNTRINDSPNSIVEGLESYSVNMLLGRINYSKLDGRSVGFWASPVLLTPSRLQDQAGNSVPWIPYRTKVEKCGVDVVNAAGLASYLDFRDREVRILGRELLSSEEGRGSFPGALRLFRALTLCASMMLIGAFFVFALNGANSSLAAPLALGLATFIEVLGGLKLIKGYQSLRRDNAIMQGCSPSVAAEQIVRSEKGFLPDERAFLYWKYGGADLSKLRKETNQQRIDDLVSKTKEIISRTVKLQNEELYSEVVLSFDRATRTAITAVLLSMGMETQGKEIEEWFPHLTRVFEDIRLEDMRYLKALRDQVNKGYDASKGEAERARDIATALIDEALQRLETHRANGGSRSIPVTPIPLDPSTYSDSSRHLDQYNMRLRSLLSTAYSAKDNGETKTFLNKLEQAVIVATRMKILQLTGKPTTALSLTELFMELEKAGADSSQRQDGEEMGKWIGKLKEGKIETDGDIEEFGNRCTNFLHSMKVVRRSVDAQHPRMIPNIMKPKSTPSSTARKPMVVKEPLSDDGSEQAQGSETLRIEMPKEILDTASSLKFILDAADDSELLEIGPAGARLLEAKKELQGSVKAKRPRQTLEGKKGNARATDPYGDSPETTDTIPAPITASAKVCDELGSITASLDQPQEQPDRLERSKPDSQESTPDLNYPMNKVSPFESLGDFKKIISRCELPIVASYLSDDELSKSVGNAMNQLVKKYHTKAAFISVDSKFRDIAIESKIKSYPTILVFQNGKIVDEMKSVELEQLDRDLSRILKPGSVISGEGDSQKPLALRKDNYEVGEEMKQDREMRKKLGVADSP